MRIDIRTIPHSQQRYPTCGDYWEDQNGIRHFRISDLANEDYEFLILIHEQIEEHLCRKRGISEESITAFDNEYERNRPEGDASEPGFAADAPYRKEHAFATKIEGMLAKELKVEWNAYDAAVNAL